MNYRTTRDGADFATPLGAIFGPKAMLINEYAGSGGDALPFYFRKSAIGPLIGKTTWGGLVGGLGGVSLTNGRRICHSAGGRPSEPRRRDAWEVEKPLAWHRGQSKSILIRMPCARDTIHSSRRPVEFLLEELKKNSAAATTKETAFSQLSQGRSTADYAVEVSTGEV